MPDAVGAQVACPRRCALAEIRAQSLEQFEGRFGLVEILPSPSLFFAGMSGSVLPVAVAHGEGRAEFSDDDARRNCLEGGLVGARYVDNYGRATESYPANLNGSPGGLTGLTTADGRATILMPHPRVFRAVQNLAASRVGRRQRLDAVLSQRPRLAR